MKMGERHSLKVERNEDCILSGECEFTMVAMQGKPLPFRKVVVKESIIVAVQQICRKPYGMQDVEATIECCMIYTATGQQIAVEEKFTEVQKRRKEARNSAILPDATAD